LLLQETPPRVEIIELKASKLVALIDLAVEGNDEIAQAWSDPNGSRGDGMALLPAGHLVIAKEKKSASFIEFGPLHSRSCGLVRGGALADGERRPIKAGHHRFVALATWFPDKTLAKSCADFSDHEIGPDGCLYLLSDKFLPGSNRRAAAPLRCCVAAWRGWQAGNSRIYRTGSCICWARHPKAASKSPWSPRLRGCATSGQNL
jgi:hypothetical protein